MQFEIEPYLSECLQLIIVKADDWNGPSAQMQCHERTGPDSEWKASGEPFEVVIGKKGLAWGQNLATLPKEPGPMKQEGDLKTPAGLYGFCFAFGTAQGPVPGISLPYLQIDENFVGVDDPGSRYYNCIVNQEVLTEKDWSSAETMMRTDGLYKWGILVDYNFVDMKPGAGSQIFLHIWRGPGQGTEGCVAMPQDKLWNLLQWMDGGKSPLIWIR